MRTIMLTLGLALMTSATLCAQDKVAPSKAASPDKHSCIMADAGVWTDLGLTSEQVAKVKEIQASCLKEHDAAKAAGTKYTAAARHETELKAVLSPEQFTKWSQWCDANEARKTSGEMKN
ncbi:MAG: hypothetical protein JNM62_07190 [Flavobacteriales bacterium]|nr:hypothetical protein [Flavobacteriales bacterium]